MAAPRTHDDYLANLSADKRVALTKLRKMIKAAAPGAEECFSYGLPAFRDAGRLIAGYGASVNHCAYYPMSGSVIAALKSDIEGYETSKGAIRFAASKPLPATLVKKLIKARQAEDKSKSPKAAEKKAAPAKKMSARRKAVMTAPSSAAAVDALLRRLDYPLTKEINAVRRIVLSVSPLIEEGVKWNAPSFRTSDWFATVNLRSRDSVQLIFHTGAKVKESAVKGVKIADPAGLANWLAKDRCMVTLGAGKDIAAKKKAFETFVGAWIKGM